jgi:hypothetical protein
MSRRTMGQFRVIPNTALKDFPMDAEQINLIGTTLEDLGTRTEDLRRYL